MFMGEKEGVVGRNIRDRLGKERVSYLDTAHGGRLKCKRMIAVFAPTLITSPVLEVIISSTLNTFHIAILFEL